MTTEPRQLDPILTARLEHLQEALDEVKDIQTAMEGLRLAFARVDDFLRDDGRLDTMRSVLSRKIGAAKEALEMVRVENNNISEAHAAVAEAHPVAKVDLDDARASVLRDFVTVRDWSPWAKESDALTTASQVYRDVLNGIKIADDPWITYEEQLEGRGQELYNAYVELLGSIAVRGMSPVDDLVDERRKLLARLNPMLPMSADWPITPVPHTLGGPTHFQLGYPQSSLWALALLAHSVGLSLIEKRHLDMTVPKHLETVCADAYATYALGPAYVAAAIFLDLNPRRAPTSEEVTDPVVTDAQRCELLLSALLHLAPAPQKGIIGDFVAGLRTAWDAARPGEAPVVPNDGDREIQEKYLNLVTTNLDAVGFEFDHLGARVQEADQLVADPWEKASFPASPQVWDVLNAMWWARVTNPSRCSSINKRARSVLGATGGVSQQGKQMPLPSQSGASRAER